VYSGPGINSSTGQINIAASIGTMTWVVNESYATGTDAYYDSEGNSASNLNSSRVSGSVSKSLSRNVIYPFFYGKSSSSPSANQSLIDGGTKVVSSSNGTLNINFNGTGQYVWFAIHKDVTAKSRYYKTALDTGAIDLIFKTPVRTSITTSLWSNQEYDFYISKVAGNHNTNMQILN